MSTADITRILSFSVVTNWFGYMLLAGFLFSSGIPRLPESWVSGSVSLRLIGALLLAVCAGYLLACRFATRREWGWRRYRFRLPSLRVALLQAGLGMSNWAMMALLLSVLLPDLAQYHEVLAVLLVSSIAGVIAHIPAGLGVLEAVFIALMHAKIGKGSLLAALIGYRVLYFLIPLLLACAVYLWLERRARKLKKSPRSKTAERGPV
ncbi:Inner membrane protein YbhN [compost metagenome]